MKRIHQSVQFKPEVLLSPSLAPSSESGFGLPDRTLKSFLKMFTLLSLTDGLACFRRTLPLLFSAQKCWHCFSHICRARRSSFPACGNTIIPKVALEGQDFKPISPVSQNFPRGTWIHLEIHLEIRLNQTLMPV